MAEVSKLGEENGKETARHEKRKQKTRRPKNCRMRPKERVGGVNVSVCRLSKFAVCIPHTCTSLPLPTQLHDTFFHGYPGKYLIASWKAHF